MKSSAAADEGVEDHHLDVWMVSDLENQIHDLSKELYFSDVELYTEVKWANAKREAQTTQTTRYDTAVTSMNSNG